ncbi:Glycosyl hydrolase family 53 [Cesiribacter andamanensis AMV16]|uniref:Arabinogalactan endo-beta-1,4-galactanase n=1 Tax=Cesiribacter andamanensis AMV16 TaxID=1279009 RepID=M7N2V2_9BACT|nr:Glycosyl hydrolase family 53 [Cesiribacter andamanensis AMV16]
MLPEYPATPEGQKAYLARLKEMVSEAPEVIGFCYWGGEWISFKGNQAQNGSSWENQALWDFENKAVPALEVFNQ